MSVGRNLFRTAGSVAFALVLLAHLEAPSPLSAAPSGEVLTGRATVIDGDTLEIAGERVRLEGIDAPEAGQTCGRKWFGNWACGSGATSALRNMVGTRRIECQSTGRDKYGRMLGLCTVDGRDINADMVRQGFAWAFVKYSKRYQSAETEAHSQKVGVWQGDSQPPWEFREQRWQVAETAAPQGCAIKGNITANGRIYHAPWSPWYAKVKVEPEKGERWFCSESEAAQAGFRPVNAQ